MKSLWSLRPLNNISFCSLKLPGLFRASLFPPFQFFFTFFRRKPHLAFYLAEKGNCFSLAPGHTQPTSPGLPSLPFRNVLPAFNTHSFCSSYLRAKHCAGMWNLLFSGRNNEFLCMLSTWKKSMAESPYFALCWGKGMPVGFLKASLFWEPALWDMSYRKVSMI